MPPVQGQQDKQRPDKPDNGQLIDIDKHDRFSDMVTPCVDCNVFFVDTMTCHITPQMPA